MFTKTEKALLYRAARRAADQASALQKSLAGLSWGATKATKRSKLEFDRLMRDHRDLRALGNALLKANSGADGGITWELDGAKASPTKPENIDLLGA
jgi:hypothetical protein